jgi:hypothetical protein
MKKFITAFVLIGAFIIVPWVLSTQYMKAAGVVVTGRVVAKREAFLLPGGDTWRHTFEITYEYCPLDSPYSETVVQRVDEGFYRTLAVSSQVRVRYSPSRLLRSFAGMGLYLEDASALSRLRYGPPDNRDIVMASALALALLLGLVAYGTKSKVLGVITAVIVLTCFPSVLLAACAVVLFPALFWACRRNPGKGYGLVLLATIALSIAVIYWRVPRPAALPQGPLRTGTAVVRQLRAVDEIWSNAWETYSRTSGESIGYPFQMVDLEFTPERATESIHALDRIDLNSVPGLREGASVPIQYSLSDPSSARLISGTRNYARAIVRYWLLLFYGIGAVLTFVFVPVARRVRKFARSSSVVSVLRNPNTAFNRISKTSQWSQLPKEDPRREQLEAALSAYQGGGLGANPRQNVSRHRDEK